MNALNYPSDFDLLLSEIHRRGIACEKVDKIMVFEASSHSERHFLSQYTLPIIPQNYPYLLDNKKNFKAILKYNNVPLVLNSKFFMPDQMIEALEYAKNILHFPVVCKPQSGASGALVFSCIQNEADFVRIWSKYYSSLIENMILVEPYLPNVSDYRLMYFSEEKKFVFARHDPYVTGNGHASVRQLIDEFLQENPQLACSYNFEDEELNRTLRNQLINLDSIPEKDYKIKLHYGWSTSHGGLKEYVSLEDIHGQYWELLKKVWAIFPRMPYFALDILASNVSVAPNESSTAINEAHVGAGARLPQGDKVYKYLVDLLFPETANNNYIAQCSPAIPNAVEKK